MTATQNTTIEGLEQLLEDGKENGGMQYISTLVRVDSYKNIPRDEVKAFFQYLQGLKVKINSEDKGDLDKYFEEITSDYETFSLITNMVRVAMGESFRFRPLPYVFRDGGPDIKPPEKGAHIDLLLKKITEYKSKNEKFFNTFSNAFNQKIIAVLEGKETLGSLEEKKEAISQMVDFLHLVLKRYFKELKNIGKGQKLHASSHPKARFEVYEILTNEENGLYGFKIHQSNGSTTSYERHDTKSAGLNFLLNNEGEMEVHVGSWDAMQPIWMVGEKPLYEIGIPGRYNIVGEWKPLLYPGSPDLIQRKASEACKNEKDKRIVGCLFQIMATCHHTIEFVVKSDFQIPHDYLSATLGGLKVQLHKLKMPDTASNDSLNYCVYDGTAFLPNADVETIGEALDTIGIFLNRIAFRTDRKVEWFIKYSMYTGGHGKMLLKEKDFKDLGEYLLSLKSSDVVFIDTAISWYTTAKNSANFFTQYLNYYIAIESLAVLLVDGKLEASKDYGFKKLNKEERKNQTVEGIKKLHEEVYPSDPILFVKQAYSECITSLRSKTERAIKAVFGEEHELTKKFSEKEEGKSMYDLRNDLAHGNYNYVDRDEVHQIKNTLPWVEEIAYQFIMKLSLGKDKKFERFKHFSTGFSFGSPRGTLVVSDFNMFPIKDWKIKWEWLSE